MSASAPKHPERRDRVRGGSCVVCVRDRAEVADVAADGDDEQHRVREHEGGEDGRDRPRPTP